MSYNGGCYEDRINAYFGSDIEVSRIMRDMEIIHLRAGDRFRFSNPLTYMTSVNVLSYPDVFNDTIYTLIDIRDLAPNRWVEMYFESETPATGWSYKIAFRDDAIVYADITQNEYDLRILAL